VPYSRPRVWVAPISLLQQEVLQEHLGIQYTQNNNKEEEQSAEPCVYSVLDTKQAFQILIEFIECQNSLSTEDLQALEQIEPKIDQIRKASLVRGILDL
jgi:hypothetical protein